MGRRVCGGLRGDALAGEGCWWGGDEEERVLDGKIGWAWGGWMVGTGGWEGGMEMGMKRVRDGSYGLDQGQRYARMKKTSKLHALCRESV